MAHAMAASVYYAVYDGYRPVPIDMDDVVAFECGSREAYVSICRDIAAQLGITVDASKFNRLDILHYSDLELFADEETDEPGKPWADWPKLPEWPTHDKPAKPDTTPAPVYETAAPNITPAPAPRTPRRTPKGQKQIPGTSARAMVKRTSFK